MKNMVDIAALRQAQRANGPATVMAIGTANPPNAYDQTTYPDFYFKVTNSEHMTDLKEKFQRLCANSEIKNRYMHFTEDTFKENPNMCTYKTPSLNARQDILVEEIPKLAKEAATKAIKEWGQSKSLITHLVFCSTTGCDAPGADFHLVKLLGLHPTVKRYMLYQQGCYGGGTTLRLAKDLAENNSGARVLVICCEITVSTFHGPCDTHIDNLVGQAIFGDGAGALIVGADPIAGVENPLFEMVLAAQTIIPDSADAIQLQTREEGLSFHLLKTVTGLISNNIRKIVEDTFEPLGISDWNSLFWIIHTGGPGILKQVGERLNLKPERTEMSRQVLNEYGNMASTSVFFVLDKMRKKSAQEGLNTTGEGLEWGVLLGFGPGLTVEVVVLRSMFT